MIPGSIITRLVVRLSEGTLVCDAELLFCLYLQFLTFAFPKEKSPETWATALGTVPHRRRVCLSVLVGSRALIWKEIRAVWDFKRCGREWVELPVLAVWSFDSYVSKQSRHIRCNSVWCWKPAKRNVKSDALWSISPKLTFREFGMNSCFIVTALAMSKLIKLRANNMNNIKNSLILCVQVWILILYSDSCSHIKKPLKWAAPPILIQLDEFTSRCSTSFILYEIMKSILR